MGFHLFTKTTWLNVSEKKKSINVYLSIYLSIYIYIYILETSLLWSFHSNLTGICSVTVIRWVAAEGQTTNEVLFWKKKWKNLKTKRGFWVVMEAELLVSGLDLQSGRSLEERFLQGCSSWPRQDHVLLSSAVFHLQAVLSVCWSDDPVYLSFVSFYCFLLSFISFGIV